MQHERFLNIALLLGQKSDYEYKIGCVIVQRKRVVGCGFNQARKTHPKSNHPYKTIHAELGALLQCGDLADGATAYIARKHRNGKWALAKPCIYCLELLKYSGVKTICYSSENGNFHLEDL